MKVYTENGIRIWEVLITVERFNGYVFGSVILKDTRL